MKVEVWSDFACPFCYIGKRHLEGALSQFPHRDQVEVVYRSFQLDPTMERDTNMDVHTVLATKYGMPLEQAKSMNERVAQQAKSVGLDYYFDTMIPTNTLDAHRLAHYAATHGKMTAMKERLLKAYFTESLHLGDHEVLAQLASEVGLDREATLAMLKSDAYRDKVKEDKRRGAEIGIKGVPFFLFNNKYAVSGAQPGEVFWEVLWKVWEEEQAASPLTYVGQDESEETDGDSCADGSCKP